MHRKPERPEHIDQLATLAREGDVTALEQIVEAMHSGAYWVVKLAAARALGQVGGQDAAVAALIAVLSNHTDAELVTAAHQSLAGLLTTYASKVSDSNLGQIRSMSDRGTLYFDMAYANDDSPYRKPHGISIVFDDVRRLADNELRKRKP